MIFDISQIAPKSIKGLGDLRKYLRENIKTCNGYPVHNIRVDPRDGGMVIASISCGSTTKRVFYGYVEDVVRVIEKERKRVADFCFDDPWKF